MQPRVLLFASTLLSGGVYAFLHSGARHPATRPRSQRMESKMAATVGDVTRRGRPTHYDVLGISRSATAAEVKKAYRAVVRVTHPDYNPSQDARNTFELATEAYSTLSNAGKRSTYDQGNALRGLAEGFKHLGEEDQGNVLRSLADSFKNTEVEPLLAEMASVAVPLVRDVAFPILGMTVKTAAGGLRDLAEPIISKARDPPMEVDVRLEKAIRAREAALATAEEAILREEEARKMAEAAEQASVMTQEAIREAKSAAKDLDAVSLAAGDAQTKHEAAQRQMQQVADMQLQLESELRTGEKEIVNADLEIEAAKEALEQAKARLAAATAARKTKAQAWKQFEKDSQKALAETSARADTALAGATKAWKPHQKALEAAHSRSEAATAALPVMMDAEKRANKARDVAAGRHKRTQARAVALLSKAEELLEVAADA